MESVFLEFDSQHYHIELILGSKQLCTMVLLWWNYEYQQLHLGVCNSPNIFQENISKLFEGFNMVHAYIYGVLVIT